MSLGPPSVAFIFFLTLGEKLPRSFYVLDKHLKKLGFMLVPIQVNQLQSLIAASEQEQVTVITSTMDMSEFKLYNEKVRTLLKYILKSPRMTYLHLSSFSKLNDTKQFAGNKNYIFIKYPIDPSQLALRIAYYSDAKSKNNTKWPGGKRAGVKGVTV